MLISCIVFVAQDKVIRISEGELLSILESQRVLKMQHEKASFIQRKFKELKYEKEQAKIQRELENHKKYDGAARVIQKKYRVLQ